MKGLATAACLLLAACSPSEGPESIPLPTSADTTTTTTSTTSTTTTTTTTTTTVPPRFRAIVRRTTDGVPHIFGTDIASVAFGQGVVSAEDHGCTLLDQILKVHGVRSAALGPGADGENVQSDFAWRAIGIAELAAVDFTQASAALVEQFEAFTLGWNTHLNDVGAEGLTGWCSGEAWVRPIEAVEVYAYARSVALLASSARVADFIPSAAPPAPEVEASGFAPRTGDADSGEPVPDFSALAPLDTGSNAWAVGVDRVEGGVGGLLLGNPHFPWEGELRFVETHLTVPGEIDIYGAQLVGLPGIGIGFTNGVAWTHTTSAGKRMTAYLLTLDPESPTSYLVDGESRPMTPVDHTIEILRPDGTVDAETRTLWRSEYGPILDFPGLGWTDELVLTYRDANLDNDEFVEQYADMLDVDSLDALIEVHRTHQGVPLFNTVAVGADGRTWYADTSATPNLSDEAEVLFLERLATDPITAIGYENGVAVLDGSDSRFVWEEVQGARDLGLVPFDAMPMVERTDYVFNANDSYWVPSEEFQIGGDFSILHGERDTALSMRTRQNAAVLSSANRIGAAGPEGFFSAAELRTAAFDNSAHTALLLRSRAVEACRFAPLVEVGDLLDDAGEVVLPAEVVDVTAACDVLEAWDGRYDLDRAGPILWREMMNQFEPADFRGPGALFEDEFVPGAATTTPAVPAEDALPLLESLARAVQILREADFEVGSTLGTAQFTERGATRIPVHGGTNTDGTTNIVAWSGLNSSTEPQPTRGEPVVPGAALRGEGYPVNFGTSFVFSVDYTSGTPEAWSLLTYGQTGDRESPLFEQQTVRFSEKDWRPALFTNEQIGADPELTERIVQAD